MPAKGKAQQRFFGMVRAAQKGEGASSPEVAKVADEISDKDAKKFAKTKHKGLPEKKKVDEATWHSVDGKKYLKLPRKHAKNAKRDTDSRSGLGKAKDAVTDTLGITNTKRDGVRKHDGIKGAFQIQNSYEPEGKLAEGDVPRGPGGNPIRIKDKIKAAKGFIPHKGKPTTKEEEDAYKYVVDKLKKKHGDGVLTKGDKIKPPTAAQKKAKAEHEAKLAKERSAEFKKDPSITAKVVENNQIEFRGNITSLSPAALIIIQEMGYDWDRISGPTYWSLNGETLSEIRRKNIGIVFQSFYLIPNYTALENVSLSLEINKFDNLNLLFTKFNKDISDLINSKSIDLLL